MNLYSRSAQNPDDNIPFMSMDELTPKLCHKCHGDAYNCIDCVSQCSYGKRAVELLEKDTNSFKPMTKKQQYSATQRIEAMRNYLEAMSAPDPVGFIIQKYGCENIRIAKNKIYQWQHNYGKNLGMISNKIKEIESEIMASNVQTNKNSSEDVKPVIDSKTLSETEEKKPTKRQEEKISRNHLEQMRTDLENEFLRKEKEIEEYKKAITECEDRMTEIKENITALRKVLEIFKEKDLIYA